jgi:serine/threonine protein kinase
LHLNETTVGDEPNVVEMVCKLCDFGVSDEFHGTSSEEIRGSIRWMCKEALRQEHAEASHDVYSYGACLYEICARRVPFMRIKDDMRVFMLICSEGAELTVPPFLPAEFANVVRSCLLEASARPSFEVLLAQLHRTVFHFGRQLDLTTNISVLEQDVLATSTLREQQRSWEPPSYL